MREPVKLKKGQPLVYLVLLVVAVAMMAMLRHCAGSGATNTSERPADDDTIRVAIEYSPLMCYTYADTLGGFNYDLIRLISHRVGRPVKFYPVVALHKAVDELEAGKVDMIVAQFPVTKENREKLLFSDEVYIDKQVLVQRKDSLGQVKIKNQLYLAGATVHVVMDSPMKNRIANLSQEIGDTIYVAEDELYGPEQLFLQVATGEIDYAVINGRIAHNMAQNYKNVDVITSISFSQIQAWAFRIDNTELQASVNTWLSEVKQTSEYKHLLARYLEQ